MDKEHADKNKIVINPTQPNFMEDPLEIVESWINHELPLDDTAKARVIKDIKLRRTENNIPDSGVGKQEQSD